MSSTSAKRSAALLALRWHAGTGALVAMTAALTLAGAVPALTVLGGTAAAPSLTLNLGDTAALLADWGGRGIVWPQLQQLAILKLLMIVRAATWLTLIVGAATLLALHLARTAARSGEVTVARALGASRRVMLGALMLESGALAGVALLVGMLLALGGVVVMRGVWPGQVAGAELWLSVAGTLGVTALVMVAPLLLVRALSTTRLVDDDRRPLTLIIPALQLGAALVVLAGGATLRGVTTTQAQSVASVSNGKLLVQDLRIAGSDRLQRAQRFAAFLEAQHSRDAASMVSLGSSGLHRGLGTIAQATSDCGARCADGTVLRSRTETVAHHAVSGDTFAVAGLRILQGRALGDRDRWDSPLVAVVNTTLARTMFANGDPVGQRIQLSLLNNAWFEVVGVVEDRPPRGLGGVMQPPLGVYVSILQHPVSMIEIGSDGYAVSADALRTLGTVRAPATSINRLLHTDTAVLAWFTNLLLAMGAVAAVIAVGGLIAMLQLWLDSQQRELGIRRAVGARRRDVHRLVLGRAALVAGGGVLFGAWLGQIFWDVLPRIVPGAPAFDGAVVLQSGVLLATLTLTVAAIMAARFTRTPVGTLLIEVG
jgi:ABC-type antimicrobial peptide transport system permease subunit